VSKFYLDPTKDPIELQKELSNHYKRLKQEVKMKKQEKVRAQ
jgi:hypothetical protein